MKKEKPRFFFTHVVDVSGVDIGDFIPKLQNDIKLYYRRVVVVVAGTVQLVIFVSHKKTNFHKPQGGKIFTYYIPRKNEP